MRPIKIMAMPGIEPGLAATPSPEFKWVDPLTLLVDEKYQRGLSERSVTLIRRIVTQWDWARFKPPIVALTELGLEVIDGQHTAIAAASSPLVGEIPIMLVAAPDMVDRARSFVGHNRDRITLTPLQIHAANVAAGDEDALTIELVCQRAGVELLRYPPGNGLFKPRQTLAIMSVRSLVGRRHAAGARRVLETLAQAECAPLTASAIKAAECLLFDAEFKEDIEPAGIVAALRALGPEAERQAKVFAAAHSVPLWRGLAVVLFKEGRRGRRRAA